MQRNSSFEARDYGKLWTHKGNKFVIGTLHGDMLEITAQYNPKELSRSASASWTPHPNTSAKQSPSHDTHIWMEYGTTEPRTLSFELLFDGYEEGISVAPLVEQLESLTLPKDMSSRTASERRPRACVAVWGSQSLRCVVMSVATNLTMFDESGEPLRAMCSITVKETDVVQMMKADRDKSDFNSREDQLKSHSNAAHKTRRHWTDDKPVADAWSKSNTPVAKSPAPAAAKPAPVVQKTPPAQTQEPKSKVEAGDAQDEQDDRDNDTVKTTGTASQPFAGDDDLDSPRASSTPAPAKTTGTPSQPFAGDDDLDSPRANSTPAKTTGTPSQPFAGDDDLDSPRANPTPAPSKVPANDLE
jgi:Contractile injection system tube protein